MPLCIFKLNICRRMQARFKTCVLIVDGLPNFIVRLNIVLGATGGIFSIIFFYILLVKIYFNIGIADR